MAIVDGLYLAGLLFLDEDFDILAYDLWYKQATVEANFAWTPL